MAPATLAAKVRHHAADLRRCAPILRASGLGRTADEIERAAGELEEALAASVQAPTPERLLQIARETNLREHLHGVPPSHARPLLARFFEAAVRDAVGIQAGARHAGADMIALPVRGEVA